MAVLNAVAERDAMAGRKGDYLFKRGDVYWVRFQYPKGDDGKPIKATIQRSTGKRDYDEAWLEVAQEIVEHKQFLTLIKQIRRARQRNWKSPDSNDPELRRVREHLEKLELTIEKGLSWLNSVSDVAQHPEAQALREEMRALLAQPLSIEDVIALISKPARPVQKPFTTVDNRDGTRSFATADQIFVNDKDGTTVETRSNEKVVGIRSLFVTTAERQDLINTIQQRQRLKAKLARRGDKDQEIMDAYKATLDDEAEQKAAQKVFEEFKEEVEGKRFAESKRSDARKLIRRWEAQGNARATLQRKISYLSKAVQDAIDTEVVDPEMTNPFRGVLPKTRKGHKARLKKKRASLTNEDIRKVEANLGRLGKDEQLLWHMLRWTGMRRSEAWQVLYEEREKGLRCIHFGQKSEASERMIPIPEGLKPHLPDVIRGCLFKRSDPKMGPRIVGKNLLRAMRRWGVEPLSPDGRKKVLHSLRHRAQSRLRAEVCPEDIREAILGHGEMTTGDGYGGEVGWRFPMTVLKPYIEQIGLLDEDEYDDPTIKHEPDDEDDDDIESGDGEEDGKAGHEARRVD